MCRGIAGPIYTHTHTIVHTVVHIGTYTLTKVDRQI